MLYGYFNYDGVYSKEFGALFLDVSKNDPLPFGIKREVSFSQFPGRLNFYSEGTEYEPLTFSQAIWFSGTLTEKMRYDLCEWLFRDGFHALICEEQPDIVYHCTITGDPTLVTNFDGWGYIEVEITCDAPFGWTKPYADLYDFREGGVNTFGVRNDSPLPFFLWECNLYIPNEDDYINPPSPPVTESDLVYHIRNMRNTAEGDGFILSSALYPKRPLKKGETLTVDFTANEITSDKSDFRLNNCNQKWISLEYGENTLEIIGPCLLTVRTQFPVLK